MPDELDEIRRRSEAMAERQRTSSRRTPMTGGRSGRSPSDRRRLALGLVERSAEAARVDQRDLENALLFAQDEGASLRAIGEASGIPHATVKRTIDRRRLDAEK